VVHVAHEADVNLWLSGHRHAFTLMWSVSPTLRGGGGPLGAVPVRQKKSGGEGGEG
jgi:hypothetical protein